MARPLRLEHAGALWHITSRGNERRPIFRDDEDRRVFINVLAGAIRRFKWRLHAYVLMGNHYHLLLETPLPNLSRGMHRINAVYSGAFNRRHERAGHLLQGRFKAILVEKERHLLELVRYVVLNPVRARLVVEPERWTWSSYRFTAGLARAPRWLEVEWTLSQFGDATSARRAYQEFVTAAATKVEEPWKRLTSQLFLGSDEFRKRVRGLRPAGGASAEVPLGQRRAVRPDLPEIVQASARILGVDPGDVRQRRRTPLRLLVAYVGRRDGLARLADVGLTLGVSVTSAHEIAASATRLLRLEPTFRGLVRRVRAEIRKIQT